MTMRLRTQTRLASWEEASLLHFCNRAGERYRNGPYRRIFPQMIPDVFDQANDYREDNDVADPRAVFSMPYPNGSIPGWSGVNSL